ncbi:MAG: hypothetical protein K2G14_07320, partial [Ruminococcus sp.]|nr:hypothetical protein [Ruminococcus sp.]
IKFDIENVELGEGAKFTSDSKETKLTWISGSTATYIKNLPDGTYTLHEVSAPNGYKVATDITFTIENGVVKGDAVVDGDTVVMVDETKDTSSNTTSSKSSNSSSSNKNSTTSSSPRTGVNDMSAVIFLMAIAVATAFISRSGKNGKED